jgi:GH3 auxin-responsive promoter.
MFCLFAAFFYLAVVFNMKLLSPAISRLARLRMWRIESWIQNPVAAQREVLQDIVTTAQYTQFGHQHQFSKLFSVRDFKNTIPVSEYEDLKPFIERMMQGEENVLWPTPINWFAKSSGTTSDKSKFIPVSEESMQDGHYKAAKDVLTLYYNNFPSSDLLTGKGLVIGGSHTISQVNETIQFGDLSAVLMQNAPFWSNWIRTPGLNIALMDEWETKIQMLAEKYDQRSRYFHFRSAHMDTGALQKNTGTYRQAIHQRSMAADGTVSARRCFFCTLP